jgi:hypothetical protein
LSQADLKGIFDDFTQSFVTGRLSSNIAQNRRDH